MTDAIEGVAKSWLADQPYQKVFKHTFNVVEDYVSYSLIALGAMVLSVKLVTTLSSGDLVCMIVGVEMEGGNTSAVTKGTLGPYPSGGTVSMISYAQTNQGCINSFYTPFEEYLPFMMLMQILILIVVEKFSLKIPRIAQKIERFYKNIVEESLFGRDPDVAEDLTDPKNSSEAISRQRQRNEICVSLKRSNIIYQVYVAKNIVLICIGLFIYLPFNLTFALTNSSRASSHCKIRINEVFGLVEDDGILHFQCQGRKIVFFKVCMWSHIILLLVHGMCALGALVWCLFFRAITQLLNTIEKLRIKQDVLAPIKDPKLNGKDFLFLFDLLAHTCGIESTLRVLTHSDENFYEIFKPNLHPQTYLTLEEDKVRVEWYPADIEKWQMSELNFSKSTRGSRHSIDIDSYEVTIFPAEKVKNTVTTAAKSRKTTTMKLSQELLLDDVYSTWFFDLNGGRTEYVITIACLVGKSRMKGEKIVTNLVPYGAEKPRSGMVKDMGNDRADIFWDPPKGEFTKYTLCVDKMSNATFSGQDIATGRFMRSTSINSRASTAKGSRSRENLGTGGSQVNLSASVDPLPAPDDLDDAAAHVRVMENLSNKLTTYTILGLEPGEKYGIELCTKTGNVSTRNPIYDMILTKPMPPRGFRSSDISPLSAVIHWLPPEGNSCLRGFQIQITTGTDAKVLKDVAVPKTAKQFTILGLTPGQDFDVSITSLCVAEEGRRTESAKSILNVTTELEKVRNFALESAKTNSLSLKWDPPVVTAQNLKFKLTLTFLASVEEESLEYLFVPAKRPPQQVQDDEDDDDDARVVHFDHEEDSPGNGPSKAEKYKNLLAFTRTVEVNGDCKTCMFDDLPAEVGAGVPFSCVIYASCVTAKENEAKSAEIKEVFLTKPYPPTGLAPLADSKFSVQWKRSLTKHVRDYRVLLTVFNPDDTVAASSEEIVHLNDSQQAVVSHAFNLTDIAVDTLVEVKVASLVSMASINKKSRSEDAVGKFVVAENLRFRLPDLDSTAASKVGQP